MDSLEILFTGTGRCATGYFAKLLTSLGTPCGHEFLFNVQQGDFALHPAESSWLAAPFIQSSPHLSSTKIVHIVREPAACIRSLALYLYSDARGSETYENFSRQHNSDLVNWNEPVHLAASHWYEWNSMIEKQSEGHDYFVYKLGIDPITDLLEKLSIQYENKPMFEDKKYNHRPQNYIPEVHLEDLPDQLRENVIKLSKHYGF